MEMSSTSFKSFRADFDSAVKELEEKYGVSIKVGKFTYDSTQFTTKMEVKNFISKEEDFANKARILSAWGFKPDMYNKVFDGRDGKKYKLIDLDTKARKNVCIIEKVPSDGKAYKCDEGFLGIKYNCSGWTVTKTDAEGNETSITL